MHLPLKCPTLSSSFPHLLGISPQHTDLLWELFPPKGALELHDPESLAITWWIQSPEGMELCRHQPGLVELGSDTEWSCHLQSHERRHREVWIVKRSTGRMKKGRDERSHRLGCFEWPGSNLASEVLPIPDSCPAWGSALLSVFKFWDIIPFL